MNLEKIKTVGELIDALQKFPRHKNIFICGGGLGSTNRCIISGWDNHGIPLKPISDRVGEYRKEKGRWIEDGRPIEDAVIIRLMPEEGQ